MKTLAYLSTAILALSVAACSSGSSSAPDDQTSTNTIPAETISDAEDALAANEELNDTQESPAADDGTVTDIPTPAADSTDTQAEAEQETTGQTDEPAEPEGGEQLDNLDETAVDEPTDATNDTSPDTDTAANNEAESDSAQTSDNAEENTEPDTEANTPATPPIINPDSNLGQLQTRIQSLASQSIQELNTAITQGELLSDQENDCVGAFDPALGEPLLTINCQQPLSVGGVPIFATSVLLNDTPECRGSLQNNNVENCSVVRTELMVNTLFIIPETAPGQAERPIPIAGAQIDYDTQTQELSLVNLQAALQGTFNCVFDLNTGGANWNGASSTCTISINTQAQYTVLHRSVQRGFISVVW